MHHHAWPETKATPHNATEQKTEKRHTDIQSAAVHAKHPRIQASFLQSRHTQTYTGTTSPPFRVPCNEKHPPASRGTFKCSLWARSVTFCARYWHTPPMTMGASVRMGSGRVSASSLVSGPLCRTQNLTGHGKRNQSPRSVKPAPNKCMHAHTHTHLSPPSHPSIQQSQSHLNRTHLSLSHSLFLPPPQSIHPSIQLGVPIRTPGFGVTAVTAAATRAEDKEIVSLVVPLSETLHTQRTAPAHMQTG